MAKSYQISVPAHPNIYEFHSRELQIHFSEPELGVNADTGILLLITGFGESAGDKYYEQARAYFADQYNLVTVQAEYFGSPFMSSTVTPKFIFNIEALKAAFKEEEWAQIYDGTINMDRLMEIGSQYPMNMEGHAVLEESLEHYNDMGIMQAIDNITAVLAVIAILKDNDYSINTGRIMSYGQGHGAYLGYLCNAFAPKLFNLLIDNSGWLMPAYLKNDRRLTFRKGKLTYSVIFNYLAAKLEYDEELLSLPTLYKRFFNNANILSFQEIETGNKGDRVKLKFCQSLKYCMYNEFISTQLDKNLHDSEILRLDPDFIKLFDYIMSHVSLDEEHKQSIHLPTITYETKRYRYKIDYSTEMPIFERTENK